MSIQVVALAKEVVADLNGLFADCGAALSVQETVLSSGIPADHDRLAMLNLNLALERNTP